MSFTKLAIVAFGALAVLSAAVAGPTATATTSTTPTTFVTRWSTAFVEPSAIAAREEPATTVVTAIKSPWYYDEGHSLRNDKCEPKQEKDIGCENLLGTPPTPPADHAAICETIPWSPRWSVKMGVPFDAGVCAHVWDAFTKPAPAETHFDVYQPFWSCRAYGSSTQVLATLTNDLVGSFNQALADVYKDVVFGDSGLCLNTACYDEDGASHIGIKATKCEVCTKGAGLTTNRYAHGGDQGECPK